VSEKYTVEGELRIRSQAGVAAVARLSDRLASLQRSISGSQTAAGGLMRSIVGLGAGYVGVQALVGSFSRLTSGAVEYQNTLQGAQIGLSSLISAVERVPFAEAQSQAEGLFETIRTDALTSVATTSELFQIFSGIYGPLRAAGQGMDQIRGTMRDTVSAASAFGIDLAQATRDVQAMARGTAGVDVRLFSMLRSTGAIAEDAEAFNRLSQPERIARMSAALGQFSSAASAYGQSFAGVTSTFRDIVETLTGAFFGPAFRELTSFLSRTNDSLLRNRDSLQRTLTRAGESVAGVLRRLFGFVDRATGSVSDNWAQLFNEGRRMAAKLMEAAPALLRAAQAFAAISVARSAIGAGLGAASAVTGAVSGAGEIGALLFGGAAGAGAAGAAGAGTGAAAGGATGLAALQTAFAGLLPVLLPLAAVVAGITSVFALAYSRAEDMAAIFGFLWPLIEQIGNDLLQTGQYLWVALRPFLEVFAGPILLACVASISALLVAIRFLVGALKIAVGIVSVFANVAQEYIVDPFIDAIMEIGRYISWLLGESAHLGREERRGRPVDTTVGDGLDELRGSFEAAQGRGFMQFAAADSGTPGARRPTVTNDFRGSRITVNQEFAQADPDRIALQMIGDINRQAEARIQSGFAPALTR